MIVGFGLTAAKEVVNGFNQQIIDVRGTASAVGIVNFRRDTACTGDVFDRSRRGNDKL